jgi:hypothetical protein
MNAGNTTANAHEWTRKATEQMQPRMYADRFFQLLALLHLVCLNLQPAIASAVRLHSRQFASICG